MSVASNSEYFSVYYTEVRKSFVSYLDSQQTSKAVTKMAARNTSSPHNEFRIISQQKVSPLCALLLYMTHRFATRQDDRKYFKFFLFVVFSPPSRVGVKAASAPHTVREMASGGRICARSRSAWSSVTSASSGCYLKGRSGVQRRGISNALNHNNEAHKTLLRRLYSLERVVY